MSQAEEFSDSKSNSGYKPTSSKRRWLFRFSVVMVLFCIVAYFVLRPHFWTRANMLSPAKTILPSAPVMTMDEYSNVVSVHPRPYEIRYSNGDNQLLIFGVSHHVNDPQNDEIRLIESRFKQFHPTISMIEGRMGLWIAGRDGVIEQFGESGAVAWQARQAGIDTFTLEMPLEEEMRQVAVRHQADHVVIFYVLRPYFGARRNGPISDPAAFIAESLRKRTGIDGVESEVTSIEDVDQVWKRDFADLPDWRDCDDRSGWPGPLQAIGASANDVRNQHWINIFAEQLNSTDQKLPRKVFAVIGCSHAVRLQPALDSLFQADPLNVQPDVQPGQ